MNEHDSEPCITAINRLYCYLRHAGIEPGPACEALETQMRPILDCQGASNPARLMLEAAVREQFELPRPAPVPAPVRGHLGYPRATG